MLTTIEKVLLLQNVDLFTHVTTEQLSFVAVLARELEVPARQVLYREHDLPDGLYVVISGSVSMRRGQEEIDRVASGQPFGIWALFDDAPRLTTAEAAEPARLLFVARDDFYDVLAEHVDIVAGLFKHLVGRLRRLASVVEK